MENVHSSCYVDYITKVGRSSGSVAVVDYYSYYSGGQTKCLHYWSRRAVRLLL